MTDSYHYLTDTADFKHDRSFVHILLGKMQMEASSYNSWFLKMALFFLQLWRCNFRVLKLHILTLI